MAWAEPQYTIPEVNRAARALVDVLSSLGPVDTELFSQYYDIVNNWRASHNFPLNTFQTNLRNSARKIDANALVAQRIKRLSSIMLKLIRSPSMKLSQMQDIGGCRAVMPKLDQVRDLVYYYQRVSQIKHDPGPMDNYIKCPKESGYRGIHLIYRYSSDKKKLYNGLKIEIQIRSRFQHAWATAVETVGAFTGQALKTSVGDDDWLRFFALMGSVIAMREKTPLVPNTPTSRPTLIGELNEYAKNLNVIDRLNGYAQALRHLESDVVNAHWYLLELKPAEALLQVRGFRASERAEAEEEYANVEKRREPGMDAVLVSVESVHSLSRAYPNYFADTSMFVRLLKQALKSTKSSQLSLL